MTTFDTAGLEASGAANLNDATPGAKWTKASFRKWECLQASRYEFDGTNAVPARELSPRVWQLAVSLQMLLQMHLCGPEWRAHGPNDAGDFGKQLLRPNAFISDNRIVDDCEMPVPVVVFDFVDMSSRNVTFYTRWKDYVRQKRVKRCILLSEDGTDCFVMTRTGKTDWRSRMMKTCEELDLPEIEIQLPLSKIS
jgi:hypothetical protein